MSETLKSDDTVASRISGSLSSAAQDIGEIGTVGAGDTNHGVNGICCSLYQSVTELLQRYSAAAKADAGKISAINTELNDIDHEQMQEMS